MGSTLRRIASIKGEIAELDTQVQASACWVRGKEVPWNFQDVWDLRLKRVVELVMLQTKLAIANATTRFLDRGDLVTPAQAIRTLDELKAQIKLLSGLPIRDRLHDTEKLREQEWDDHLDKTVTRVTEVTYTSAMGKVAQKEMISTLKARFADLNDALEAHNHKTSLEG